MANTDTMSASMQGSANAPAVLIISDDKFNDLELFYPYYRLCEEGFRVEIASPDGKEITGSNDFSIPVQKRVADCNPADYALLYLPGGKAPASLRDDENVKNFVKQFVATGKPVAAICHGPQILAAAGVIQGKRLTAWPEVEKEINEAGGRFENRALLEDGQFITSRWPGDLPNHLAATLKALKAKSQIKSAA